MLNKRKLFNLNYFLIKNQSLIVINYHVSFFYI